jgi:O-antigen ligase
LFLSVFSPLCYQFLGIVLCFCFVSLRLFYPMVPFSLDCAVFLFCFSPSCLPYDASFSGLCCIFALQHNPEKLAAYGRQDGEKQKKNTTQSRETGNIGYTRRRETNTAQSRETGNIARIDNSERMLPVSLDCVVYLLCFSPSCVPYVAGFSGLCCVFALFLSVFSPLCYQQTRETGNIG